MSFFGQFDLRKWNMKEKQPVFVAGNLNLTSIEKVRYLGRKGSNFILYLLLIVPECLQSIWNRASLNLII